MNFNEIGTDNRCKKQAIMKIKVEELRSIATILFDDLESKGCEFVELDKDYYWHVSKEDVYNPYIRPTELTLGQLQDDWDILQELLHGKSEPMSHHLIWFAMLCRAVGEEYRE